MRTINDYVATAILAAVGWIWLMLIVSCAVGLLVPFAGMVRDWPPPPAAFDERMIDG